MKKIFLPFLLIFALIGCSKFSADIQKSSYKNFEEAQVDIEHGWIPDILPKSATDIYEEHDLDSNIGYGEFKIPSDEVNSFYSKLTPTKDLDIFRDGIDYDWDNKHNISKDLEGNALALGEYNNFIFAVKDNGEVYYRLKGEK